MIRPYGPEENEPPGTYVYPTYDNYTDEELKQAIDDEIFVTKHQLYIRELARRSIISSLVISWVIFFAGFFVENYWNFIIASIVSFPINYILLWLHGTRWSDQREVRVIQAKYEFSIRQFIQDRQDPQ